MRTVQEKDVDQDIRRQRASSPYLHRLFSRRERRIELAPRSARRPGPRSGFPPPPSPRAFAADL